MKILYIAAAILIGSYNVSEAGVRWVQSGEASWYGNYENGRLTASGERFNRYQISAAHRTLPLGTIVRVTDEDTGKSLIVRINDRGPFKIIHGRHGRKVLPHPTRIIDLSEGAAKKIGLIRNCHTKLCEPGIDRVHIRVLRIPRFEIVRRFFREHG